MHFYIQVICPVKPLGAAAVLQHSSGFAWNFTGTISFGSEGYKYAEYPFILLPPWFVSHLLQISLQCVFREPRLSPSWTDSKARRFKSELSGRSELTERPSKDMVGWKKERRRKREHKRSFKTTLNSLHVYRWTSGSVWNASSNCSAKFNHSPWERRETKQPITPLLPW